MVCLCIECAGILEFIDGGSDLIYIVHTQYGHLFSLPRHWLNQAIAFLRVDTLTFFATNLTASVVK